MHAGVQTRASVTAYMRTQVETTHALTWTPHSHGWLEDVPSDPRAFKNGLRGFLCTCFKVWTRSGLNCTHQSRPDLHTKFPVSGILPLTIAYSHIPHPGLQTPQIEPCPSPSQEDLITMIIECCANERSYLKFYGLIAQRFCEYKREYQDTFQEAFVYQVCAWGGCGGLFSLGLEGL